MTTEQIPTVGNSNRNNSLSQIVIVQFPKTFKELEFDLEDAASYAYHSINHDSDGDVVQLRRYRSIEEMVDNQPLTHFDLFRNRGSKTYLKHGVWEGIGGRNYVDGLIFFYVAKSGLDNAEKLKKQYVEANRNLKSMSDPDESEQQEIIKFANKYSNMEKFFDNQIEFFSKYGGCFVALARILETYDKLPEDLDKDTNEGIKPRRQYYSRFDLNKFYFFESPIQNGLKIRSPQARPSHFNSSEAKCYYDKMIAQNEHDLKNKNQAFNDWLKKRVISDESDYLSINEYTWKREQVPDLFSQDAKEDEDVRAYFANYFVNELAEENQYNSDVHDVYKEKTIYRGNQSMGIADYIIRIKQDSESYWLPVEVKRDIRRMKPNVLIEQLQKYVNADEFTVYSGKKRSFGKKHDIVCLIDKNGIYVTINGQYQDEKGEYIQFFERHLFQKNHDLVDEIRSVFISHIKQSIARRNPVIVRNTPRPSTQVRSSLPPEQVNTPQVPEKSQTTYPNAQASAPRITRHDNSQSKESRVLALMWKVVKPILLFFLIIRVIDWVLS